MTLTCPINNVSFIISEQLGRIVEGITMIYDVEGLGLKHLWKPAIETFGEVHRPGNRPVAGRHHPVMFFCITRSSRCLRKTTPKAWKDCLSSKVSLTPTLIGLKSQCSIPFFFPPAAPKIFPVAYNLVKHFLSENTRQKIFVLGGEALWTFLYCKKWGRIIFLWLLCVWLTANWQEVLLKHIDAEELPVIYGGKLMDPDGDPRCRNRVSRRTGVTSWPWIGASRAKMGWWAGKVPFNFP